MENTSVMTTEFTNKVKQYKKDWYGFYKKISKEKTPELDGAGRKIIRKRPDGYDYIEEVYMREALDKHFPGWSWEAAAPMYFLGSEWVVAQGHLIVVDEHLLAYGINPPLRKFYGIDSVRIQYRKDTPHTPENVVDVGDNCKQANTAALKYAINRLTHIGDDVYGKRIEENGMGTIDDVLSSGSMTANTAATAFNMYVKNKRLTYSKVFEILGIKSMADITDFEAAYNKLKGVVG